MMNLVRKLLGLKTPDDPPESNPSSASTTQKDTPTRPMNPASTRPLVALTGATGFIGQWLLKELPKRGYRLRVLLRRPSAVPIPANASWPSVHCIACRIELCSRRTMRSTASS